MSVQWDVLSIVYFRTNMQNKDKKYTSINTVENILLEPSPLTRLSAYSSSFFSYRLDSQLRNVHIVWNL